MPNAQAPERYFRVYRRGDVREEILSSYRVHLRQLVNPDTNLPFGEDEIATATAEHSQPWIKAEAIDLAMLAKQNNGLFLADQVRVRRAGTSWLEGYHGPMWGKGKLAAVGGAGPATQSATPGTIFVGNAVVPDPTGSAYVCTAPDGKRFQLLFTVITPGSGVAALTFQGLDTGAQTNLAATTELIGAANIPPGATGNASVSTLFTGGIGAETDADFSDRIADDILHKPACGNWAHVRSWARESSADVEDAFIYCCTLNAGTLIVCVTQKRGSSSGPAARLPSPATLANVVAYLTPPASPVLPARPYLVVVGPQTVTIALASSLVMQLSMPVGQVGGWTDPVPWPTTAANAPVTVTNITNPTHWQITIPAGSSGLPAGVTAPSMMVWDNTTSRFETLAVQSVTLSAGLIYDVVLSAASTKVITLGDYISPDSGRHLVVAQAIEAYFDSLGPGELVASTDTRWHRAARQPLPSESWPQRAGDSVITYLLDALGSALADAALLACSNPTPPVPTDPIAGPNMCQLGRVGVYSM